MTAAAWWSNMPPWFAFACAVGLGGRSQNQQTSMYYIWFIFFDFYIIYFAVCKQSQSPHVVSFRLRLDAWCLIKTPNAQVNFATWHVACWFCFRFELKKKEGEGEIKKKTNNQQPRAKIFGMTHKVCGDFHLYWSLVAVSALVCVLSFNTSGLIL